MTTGIVLLALKNTRGSVALQKISAAINPLFLYLRQRRPHVRDRSTSII